MPLVLAAGSLRATTLRVAQDGSGAYTVIQDAVNAAASGDTISIGPGEYLEEAPFLQDCCNIVSTNVGVFQDRLWLIGDSAEEVVIGPVETSTGIAIAMRYESADELHVRDVSIRNQYCGIRVFGESTVRRITSENVGIGVVSFADTLLVQHCEFVDSRHAGVALLSGSQNGFVTDCKFQGGLVGVDLFDSRNARIEGNIFADCEVGINVGDWSNPVILRNRVECAVNYGVALVHDSDATLIANTICGGYAALFVVSAAGGVVRSNSFIGGSNSVVRMQSTCDMEFSENLFLKQGDYSIYLRGYYAPAACSFVDMSNNYWFTTDTDSIQGWMHDGHVEPNIEATVQFLPILENKPVGVYPGTVGSLKSMFLESGQ